MKPAPCLPALLASLLAAPAPAQDEAGAAAFRQACLDATTDALVLNVAGHPDDEADRTLAVLRRGRGIRTVTAYTTYGSGGQNATGREIGDALARIRVRETLAAAAHTGVEVRWLGFRDFGYSKSAQESFEVWGGKEELVGRLAALLDELRPDVVLTNHAPDRGHGHHRASAIALREALERHPDIALYQRIWSFEGGDDSAVPDWECDPFAWDVARGATFAWQASRARHEHRSQGPWREHDPMRIRSDRWQRVLPEDGEAGRALEAHLGSVLAMPAFTAAWAGQDGDLDRLAAELAAFAGDRSRRAHVAAARALLPRLRDVGRSLSDDAEGSAAARRLSRRIDALERVVLLGSGVAVEAWLGERRLVAGARGRLHVLVQAADPTRVTAVRARCRGVAAAPIEDDPTGGRALVVDFPVDELQPAAGPGLEPTWVETTVQLAVDDLPLRLERRLPAEVVPPLELAWDRSRVLVPARDSVDRVVSLRARRHADADVHAEVTLDAPSGLEAEAWPARVALTDEHPTTRVLVRVRAPEGLADDGVLRAVIGDASARLELVRADVRVDPDLRVALVGGPDDTLQQALDDLGVPVDVLDEAALAGADLSDYTTVVLDIRAYHHRPDLADHRQRLLRFAENGGRVVVFYHKPGEWNERDGRPLLAPRPLVLGNDRVAEEDAAAVRLVPDHRLWTWPHRIGDADFQGWVQERGLNFAREWDEAWVPLLEMSDTGEEPLRGALLWTGHGEGDFVYCALALYRQLREGHPGAARILLNLLTP